MDEGILTHNLHAAEPTQNDNIFKSNDNSFRIFLVNFLNNHYIKSYIYNIEYISWYLSYNYLKSSNILNLKYKNEIIGNIIAKPNALKINNNLIFTHVDMLSVHKVIEIKIMPYINFTYRKRINRQRFKTFIFRRRQPNHLIIFANVNIMFIIYPQY